MSYAKKVKDMPNKISKPNKVIASFWQWLSKSSGKLHIPYSNMKGENAIYSNLQLGITGFAFIVISFKL